MPPVSDDAGTVEPVAAWFDLAVEVCRAGPGMSSPEIEGKQNGGQETAFVSCAPFCRLRAPLWKRYPP
jgi:hypothetical protein